MPSDDIGAAHALPPPSQFIRRHAGGDACPVQGTHRTADDDLEREAQFRYRPIEANLHRAAGPATAENQRPARWLEPGRFHPGSRRADASQGGLRSHLATGAREHSRQAHQSGLPLVDDSCQRATSQCHGATVAAIECPDQAADLGDAQACASGGDDQPQSRHAIIVKSVVSRGGSGAGFDQPARHVGAQLVHRGARPGGRLRDGMAGASAGTARELLDVLGEGLRAQLEPFHHRQVREQLVGQVVHRHARPQRERGALDQLARLGRDGLHAQQPPAAGLGHQLDEAAGVEVGERARHVVQRQRAAVGLDALRMRFGRCQPTVATCGSVKTTAGIALRSSAASPPVMLIAARVPAAAAT
jgi:hypothetical protein